MATTTAKAAKAATRAAKKATKAAKSAVSIKENRKRFEVIAFIFALFFGWVWDFSKWHQSEDKTDARNSPATRHVRWVSIAIWTVIATLFAAFTPAFWRGYIGMATNSNWFLEWLFGWTLNIPLFGHLIAFTANLPIGALAPLGGLFLWTTWANRITVAKQGGNPDPHPHTFTERYEQTPLFWLAFGSTVIPAGLWLLLDGMEQADFAPDQVAGLAALVSLVFVLTVSVIGALRIRTANASKFADWQHFNQKFEQVLKLPVATLAAQMALPRGDKNRFYFPKKMPDGSLQLILPPGKAWEALDSADDLPRRIAKWLPEYEVGQPWDSGIILIPVTEKEALRRDSLEKSGGITDVPLGFEDPEDTGEWLKPAPY